MGQTEQTMPRPRPILRDLGWAPGWVDPRTWTSPPSSIDPGQGHILEGHNDDEGERDQAIIKQGHYVAASVTGEDEASQKTSQADKHCGKGRFGHTEVYVQGWARGQNEPRRLGWPGEKGENPYT